jgi:hypothetical protein
MLIMAKDRGYDDLLKDIAGRNVHVWTCNTCARLCYGLGGRESAERLARRLREDDVNIVGVSAVPASCIESSIRKAAVPDVADLILSLTCDIGAKCAGDVFGKKVLNPVTTFGQGMISEDRGPVLLSVGPDGKTEEKTLLEICGTGSPDTLPFV